MVRHYGARWRQGPWRAHCRTIWAGERDLAWRLPAGMEKGRVKDTPIPGLSDMADGGDILETGRSGRAPDWTRKRRSPTWDNTFNHGGDRHQPTVWTHPLQGKPSGKGAVSSEVLIHAGKLCYCSTTSCSLPAHLQEEWE